MEKYQVAIIGSGPAGYVAAIRSAQLGFKTLVVEKYLRLGGTCLNVGCVPSKTLLNATEKLDTLQRHGLKLGLEWKDLRVNWEAMQSHRDEVVKGLTDGVAFLFQKNKVQSVQGVAQIVAPNQIKVGKETVEADHIVIASGSKPVQLPFLPFDKKHVISSTEALVLPEIPKRMAIIGGGVIGVEIASVYNRLGTQVTVVEMLPEIVAGLDSTLSRNLLQLLSKQGITFHLNTQVTKAEKGRLWLKGEKEGELETDIILVAVGRKPYSQGLGLEQVGVKTGPRGHVLVNERFQTSIPSIYAIGDVIDGPMLAHKGMEEGIAAMECIANLPTQVHYLSIPNVVYTFPEAASVGLTEKEAKDLGLKILIGTCSYKAISRARCTDETDGLIKVIADEKTHRLLGLHILGANGSEMIGEGVIALVKKATLEEIAYASHAHPTLLEGVKEACLHALKRSINF